ncbi:amidohydrolase family protein [Erythrobacter sp. HL-111]|uniref:amidohydrolase family protein n=1 Tax=Erythrobacter sp. HL-111 TaxID=1798193 RepID=UPI0006DACFB4|nr:amidohydrolase family protein [Erythrobacter sp. HL-111]KPP92610.1 MAG: putative amidohydrolase [Erythrobacteraceae bacterium HL-111]SDS94336.1 Imidazolonepropionase [Erythrobacter sp. HL-111]
MTIVNKLLAGAVVFGLAVPAQAQDIAVRGEQVHTMAGPMIENGVVVIDDGKIVAVGPEASTPIPEGVRVMEAKVVTPGLVDARTVVGLAGYLNQDEDQDQLDESAPVQPQLRAIDAYNPQEVLVEWLRGFGITTIHTGHGPGALVSGQTMVAKTAGLTADDAMIRGDAMVAANLGPWALTDGSKSPGTRAKQIALLRKALLDAQAGEEEEGDTKAAAKPPSLQTQVLREVLAGRRPLLVTAHRSQDIMSALRLKEEFGIDLVLDGASEAYLLTDAIKAAGVDVILHPPMARQYGELENASFTTGAVLRDAAIPFAYQSGYEGYVPKTRVVLWEAAMAAANGLEWNEALSAITIDAARIVGVDDRVGSIEVGKDGDVALFDGDPFEYTSHAVGVVIDGEVVSETPQ